MAMPDIHLRVRDHTTSISVGSGLLDHIGAWVSTNCTPHLVCICSDTTVWPLYGGPVTRSLERSGVPYSVHVIPPGDGSKCFAELEHLVDALARVGIGRDGLLLAVGGGVVSDLTGLTAAIWTRGVRYVNCPTTLEACVDAAIGGKTGINHAAGKNLVGAFHQPEWVAIDPACLRTLPRRDVAAGLAECVKHGLIADASLFQWYESNADAIIGLDDRVTEELIQRNVAIKVSVVEQDEKEQGRRAILNFGHTLGHAIESHEQYRLRHGEAVSLGMLCAAWMSHRLGLVDATIVERIRTLLARFGLPTTFSCTDLEAVIALTRSDKKSRAGRRRWVLLDGIGSTIIRDDVPDDVVRDGLRAVLA